MSYILVRESLIETCSDPQVIEVQTVEGFILYIRFKDGYLTCQEKWSGNYLAAGTPYLERNDKKLTFERIEFYLEMYSKFKLQFR